MTKRFIAIGDTHGTLDEVKELIDLLQPTKNDYVLFLGDLVDKGPYGPEVVQYVHDQGYNSLIGNHDHKQIRYYKHELKKLQDPKYKNPMKLGPNKTITYNSLKERGLLPWLSSRPSYYLDEQLELVAVHGGVVAGKTIHKQDERDLYYRRYITKEGKFLSLDQYQKNPSATVHWADVYTGPYKHVFYGHSVRSITTPYIVEYKEGIFTYGIDTGCVHGAFLTAAVINKEASGPDWLTFVQVKAKKCYNGLRLTEEEL